MNSFDSPTNLRSAFSPMSSSWQKPPRLSLHHLRRPLNQIKKLWKYFKDEKKRRDSFAENKFGFSESRKCRTTSGFDDSRKNFTVVIDNLDLDNTIEVHRKSARRDLMPPADSLSQILNGNNRTAWVGGCGKFE